MQVDLNSKNMQAIAQAKCKSPLSPPPSPTPYKGKAARIQALLTVHWDLRNSPLWFIL